MTSLKIHTEPYLLKHVGVLGGGRMGAGIAHAFLISGVEVTLVERDESAAEAARARVERSLQASLERGALGGSCSSWLTSLHVNTDISTFADADLIIEAVPEDFRLKQSSLQAVEAAVGEDAWIASNTSSLSLEDLSSGLERPERFCGLHFFNPVPTSKLVEIVVGSSTAEELRELAQSWVRGLGKAPITVRDSPGFASSRLGVLLGLEAVRMLEEGVATAADIDTAMVLGYKHPVGPLATTDIVGLDVRLGIAEYLETHLGARFRPPRLMREMVARGELGRKTGKGFYVYE